MTTVNYKLIATQVGNQLKYATSVNEINRIGQSILMVSKEDFPNSAITSVRAQALYSWVLSLAKTTMEDSERVKRLVNFCLELTPESEKGETIKFLERNNCPYNLIYKDGLDDFSKRNFHGVIVTHSQKLFLQGNYFHAVFETVKTYNKLVKEKSLSDKDGQALMLSVWGLDSGVLKITAGTSQTDKDYHDGIKFIAGGLMSAIRNPTAHEPAINWPIEKQDCLDILSIVSFLLRQLDKAVYFKL